MTQSSDGHPNEAPVTVDLTREGQSDFVRHATLDLTWMIWETLDSWRDPDPVKLAAAYGPLPWRPSENGDLVLIVRRYTGQEGWWITPETTQ